MKEDSRKTSYGKETTYGSDQGEGVPRCVMASKFISTADPTGEKALNYWIQQGHLQETCWAMLGQLVSETGARGASLLKDHESLGADRL